MVEDQQKIDCDITYSPDSQNERDTDNPTGPNMFMLYQSC
jgi:hypothetical protein